TTTTQATVQLSGTNQIRRIQLKINTICSQLHCKSISISTQVHCTGIKKQAALQNYTSKITHQPIMPNKSSTPCN
ncbi:hypothetical protein KKJ04_24735, partial [Xenorhabdus bovienii]|uniref:hypothetical protein n=1 Tax=Xenorhabdus bovienii TaxID=40576 RepID=UPI0023B3302B